MVKCAIYIFLDNGTHTIRTGAQVRTYERKRTHAHTHTYIHARTRKRMIQNYLNENDKLTNNNKKVCS